MMGYWFLQTFSRILHNWYFLEIFRQELIFTVYCMQVRYSGFFLDVNVYQGIVETTVSGVFEDLRFQKARTKIEVVLSLPCWPTYFIRKIPGKQQQSLTTCYWVSHIICTKMKYFIFCLAKFCIYILNHFTNSCFPVFKKCVGDNIRNLF